jgi:hypothetical protein
VLAPCIYQGVRVATRVTVLGPGISINETFRSRTLVTTDCSWQLHKCIRIHPCYNLGKTGRNRLRVDTDRNSSKNVYTFPLGNRNCNVIRPGLYRHRNLKSQDIPQMTNLYFASGVDRRLIRECMKGDTR